MSELTLVYSPIDFQIPSPSDLTPVKTSAIPAIDVDAQSSSTTPIAISSPAVIDVDAVDSSTELIDVHASKPSGKLIVAAVFRRFTHWPKARSRGVQQAPKISGKRKSAVLDASGTEIINASVTWSAKKIRVDRITKASNTDEVSILSLAKKALLTIEGN